jgi:23S rRNA pseudouridine2605 synthase
MEELGGSVLEERLQKILSAAGICSRRAAEELLTTGRVRVNGVTAKLGDRADPESDAITLDGVPVAGRQEPVYLLLNKPRGYVTTLSDEKGRPTVADLVRACGVRVYPVGRLDLQSEGLLLMTNDGELMQRLLHPSHEIRKTYYVSVSGELEGAAERLRAVRELDGCPIAPAEVELLRQTGPHSALLSVTIHEGKNRQIRRMCAACGLEVKRLQRVREHNLTLKGLKPGQWRYLTEQELAELKNTSP